MRVTPKISDSPTAIKNSPEAVESPLSAWNRNALKVMSRFLSLPVFGEGGRRSRPGGGFQSDGIPHPAARFARSHPPPSGEGLETSVRFRRPQLLHLGIARQHILAV